jgi:hypothetical protein
VRFALSDEFLLFFKIIKKLGHTKFIKFLMEKHQWIEQLLKKVDPLAIIGHPKDTLSPFHSLSIMEHIYLNPGTKTYRHIEIFEPYSVFYFYLGIKNLDINIRLYYMGTFSSNLEQKRLLLNKEKAQLEFRGNIIAIEKGIYMF